MKLFIGLFLFTISGQVFAQNFYLFVGTYTRTTESRGIYVYRFNVETGILDSMSCTEAVNPSFLTVSPNGKYVYACTETKMETEGNISAFRFDKKSGTLKFINKQPSGGRNPVYVSAHASNKWLAVANYTDPGLAIFKTKKNGKIMPYSNITLFEGNGPDTVRQASAHLHTAVFSPNQANLIVTNLGSDEISSFPFHSEKKTPIYFFDGNYFHTNMGGGPRHVAIDSNGKYLYCIEELTGTISVFDYLNGMLPMQTVSLHTGTERGPFASSDIHISPDGLYLYAANRGNENNIVIFSIDASNGILTLVGSQSTLGENPRNFCIDPTGNFLLVANQTSGDIVVFKRDKITGLLIETGMKIHVPAPSCLQMIAQ